MNPDFHLKGSIVTVVLRIYIVRGWAIERQLDQLVGTAIIQVNDCGANKGGGEKW